MSTPLDIIRVFPSTSMLGKEDEWTEIAQLLESGYASLSAVRRQYVDRYVAAERQHMGWSSVVDASRHPQNFIHYSVDWEAPGSNVEETWEQWDITCVGCDRMAQVWPATSYVTQETPECPDRWRLRGTKAFFCASCFSIATTHEVVPLAHFDATIHL